MNKVQDGGSMKKSTISKQALIDVARHIVFTDGLDALSIRRVAKDADVSVGSVYNYFESKNDLTIEVINEFWDKVMIGDLKNISAHDRYTTMLKESFKKASYHARIYHSIFIGYYRTISEDDRKRTIETHHRNLKAIEDVFKQSLDSDAYQNPSIWNDNFTKEKFNAFVVRNFLESLRHGDEDIDFLIELISHTLYK